MSTLNERLRAALQRPCPFDFLRGYAPATAATEAAEFPGIVAFSAAQGRTREHVWRVLKGQRQSQRLMAAWQKFQTGRVA